MKSTLKKLFFLSILPSTLLLTACETDEDGDGYTSEEGDCNDSDASIHPEAVEVCDGIDQNCDSQIDEDVKQTWYLDYDNDGFGDIDSSVQACSLPDGYSADSTDCDDANSNVYPNAFEVEDGFDNDCDGEIDDTTEHLQMAVGEWHSLALESNGTVWAWGDNAWGQLGDGTSKDKATPIPVKHLADITFLAAGALHSLALKEDGTVWAWGYNWYGQLGDGTYTDKLTPVQVQNLTNVVSLGAGAYHSFALKEDGSVWAWGYNSSGQLGDGTMNFCHPYGKATPVAVKNLTNIISVTGGVRHSLALESDGTVWAWGKNDSGQLGNGKFGKSTMVPVQVKKLTNIISITAGSNHSIALKSDGSVWVWGDNEYGQLGNETTRDLSTPEVVKNLTNISSVAGGNDSSFALKSDGNLWAWGDNYWGQLGDGTNEDKFTPVSAAKNLTNITSVVSGGDHCVALKSDNTAWAWGRNHAGQLGDGTNENRSTPVAIKSLTTTPSLTEGNDNHLALKSNSKVWARESNDPKANPATVKNPVNTIVEGERVHLLEIEIGLPCSFEF